MMLEPSSLEEKINETLEKENEKQKIFISSASIGILVFVLTAVIFPFKTSVFEIFYQKPASQAASEKSQGAFRQDEVRAEAGSEFNSNELLIKVKKDVRGKIKENPNDTGVVSLNDKFKVHKIKNLEKVIKSQKGLRGDEEILSWYKITLDKQQEKIKGVFDQKIGKLESKHPAAADLQLLIDSLKQDPNVEIVQLNQVVSLSQIATDSATPCTRANPIIKLTPDTRIGKPGEKLSYLVYVTNTDNSSCPASAFDVSMKVPAGWTKTGDFFYREIAPGQTPIPTVLDFTSLLSTTSGTYTFEVTVKNQSFPTYQISSTVNATLDPIPSPTPMSSVGSPNDPYYHSSGSWGQGYDDLYGVKKVQAGVWNTTMGEGVVVANIDSGMDLNHIDLKDNVWVNPGEIANNGIDDNGNGYIDDINGWNVYHNNNNLHDGNGHGTHVSGTIAAVINNGQGVVGVAPKVKIMPVRIFDDLGYTSWDSVAKAIIYAVSNGAEVINHEYACASSCPSVPIVEDAMRVAYNAGIVNVIAAGNSSFDIINISPQNMTDTKPIVVSAIDYVDNPAYFTNFGDLVDVAAPGVDILSTRSSNSRICGNSIVDSIYCRLQGTSMATPHGAGVAALIKAAKPDLSPEEVRLLMRVSADDIQTPGRDLKTGSGRVNAAKAVGSVISSPNPSPVASPSLLPSPSPTPPPDTTPPLVSVTKPLVGELLSKTTTIDVLASDNIGVTKVEFLIDDQAIATDSAAPYSINWDTAAVSSGKHLISARAADAALNQGVSTPVNIIVDNTAPSVSITAPANSAEVSGAVNINVSATDNNSLAKVEFVVDGSLIATDTTVPYSATWNATGLTSGSSHSVLARAYDNAGNSASSAVVTVVIKDATPPIVTITNPLNGDTVSETISITADAFDDVGATKVEFFVDGVLKFSDTTAPYAYSWSSRDVINGSHSLSVAAQDDAGNIGSDAITVSVANSDITPPSAPTNLTATAPAYNRVSLTWNAATDNVGVEGYWIVRGGVTIATTTATTYSDSTVSSSTTYNYQAIAYDQARNNSFASNPVSVITPAAPDIQAPSAPTNLTASAVSASQINLSWDSSSDNVGVTGYQIFRNNSLIATVNATSYGDTGLNRTTTYTYFVRAVDGAGNISANSNSTSATTLTPATTGNITGTVLSSQGGILVGAKVQYNIGKTRYIHTTNSAGGYFISNLAPGNYILNYSAKRHRSQSLSVAVEVGITTIQNVTLQR